MTDAAQSFLDGRVTLHAGDCLDVLDAMPANSVDAVITDPPYHFDTIVARFGGADAAPAKSNGETGVFARASAGFMGKDWDGGDIAFRPETWAKVLRVLKPGGHLAAFSAPKCVHKMAFGIEAAGFEVRDRIVHLFDPDPAMRAFLESLTPAQADALFRIADRFGALGEAFWIFGSGFPKSHDVAKAIDKAFGTKGETVPQGAPVRRMIPSADQHKNGWEKTDGREYQPGAYAAGSPEAETWQGWGTALKPAYEPIVIARKPIAESSVARQVLKTGTGGINVDAGRVGTERTVTRRNGDSGGNGAFGRDERIFERENLEGRFPANLSHDGSSSVATGFPETLGGAAGGQSGRDSVGASVVYDGGFTSGGRGSRADRATHDSGSAARFFYSAKADAHDRIGSGHPTVKPLDLMRWLARMLTPPGGTILDLFAGTGTTGEAAFLEGFSAILIEREAEYRADIARRMDLVLAGDGPRRREAARAKAERRGDAPPLALFAGIDDQPNGEAAE